MDQEREDYADPPGPLSGPRELAWALASFLVPPLLLILIALCFGLGSLNY